MCKLEGYGSTLDPTVNPFHEEPSAARPRPFLPRRSFDVFVNVLTRPFPSHRPISELTELRCHCTFSYHVIFSPKISMHVQKHMHKYTYGNKRVFLKLTSLQAVRLG
jgi:hypothetical protein